ncbi:MAG TPA: hypothetical protein VMV49_05090 [Candidatus Deferrimicrobium sp.]|nr:hypothetical protein [Candidatus Deferrimicrobium sp.]
MVKKENDEKQEYPESLDYIPELLKNMNSYSELKTYLLKYLAMIKEQFIIKKRMAEKEAFHKISFIINIIVLNQYMLNLEDFHVIMDKTKQNTIFSCYIYDLKNDIYYLRDYEELINKIIDLGIPYEKLIENIAYWIRHSGFYILSFEELLKNLFKKKNFNLESF